MKAKTISLAAAALGAAASFGAGAEQAAPATDSGFSLSGFGTLGLTKTDTDDAFFSAVGVPNGAKRSVTAKADSKLGIQASEKLNSVFSGTVQVLSKDNGDGNFKPGVEWAFAKAKVNSELSLRAGRIGAPLFAISDFRDVNYANLWVRPPEDVYSQVPISHLDGGDAILQKTLGTTTFTGQAFYGTGRATVSTLKLETRRLAGVNLTAELEGGLTLRIGTAEGRIDIRSSRVDGLLAAIRGTTYTAVADSIDPSSKYAHFTGVGVAYDRDDWTANAEYTWKRTGSYIPNTTGWEATLGHHWGAWTPFTMVSRVSVDSSNVVNTIPKSDPSVAPLSHAVDSLIAGQYSAEHTVSAGMRWDACKNIALKAQYDRVTPDHDSHGEFNNPSPGFGSKPVNVYALTVDFVF